MTGQERTAIGLVAQSPLQFDYVPERGHQAGAPASTAPNPTTSNKTFILSIQEQPNHMHKTRIRESLLYGRWPEQAKLLSQTSLAMAALRWSVPRDLAHAGLVDWESHGQLEGPAALGTFLKSNQDYVQARSIRQRNKVAFDSLVEAYNSRDGKKEDQDNRRETGRSDVSGSETTFKFRKVSS